MTRSPYRLFDSYGYEDHDLFFGRDDEIEQTVRSILSARLLVLFAPSGSGKTSLLAAGVRPRLEERGLDVVVARVGDDPIASVVQELRSLGGCPSPDATDLATALRGRTRPVVVFIDQFEEFFLNFSAESEKRKSFPGQLAEVLFDSSLRVYFVLSLRDDYFVSLNEFRAAIPTIFHNNANFELRPFDDACALDAIVKPSLREGSGFSWEPRLPERIVGDLKDPALNPLQNGVPPITLQIVCHTLWSRLPDGRGTISAAHYEAEGGAAEIIQQRIFGPLGATPARDRRFLCRTLRELITTEKTKRLRRRADLEAGLTPRQRQRLADLLARLEEGLLIRQESARGDTWVELRHDYLARQIAPWIEREERRLDARRRRTGLVAGLCCAALAGLAALAIWCLANYRTYTAELGGNHGQDELVISRRLPFWQSRVWTGFFRNVLQFGGVTAYRFDVPNALSDWRAVEGHLASSARTRLQFATRLDTIEQSQTADLAKLSAELGFDSLKHRDIALFLAADDKVMRFALAVLRGGDPEAKRAAADALGRLRSALSPSRIGDAVEALLKTLEESPESAVKCSAADALGTLGARLPPDRAGKVVDALLPRAQNDPDPSVRRFAVSALGSLGASIPNERAPAVVNVLLRALRNEDAVAEIRVSAADALGALGADIPASQVREVVDALFRAQKDSSPGVTDSAADALGRLTTGIPTDRAGAVVDALLKALRDPAPDAKLAVIPALGDLGARLPGDRAPAVVAALLSALNDPLSEVRRSAVDALGRLGAHLPREQTADVVNGLLRALSDKSASPLLKRAAALALSRLGTKLSSQQAADVVKALLAELKGKETHLYVRPAAADALGSLAAVLPPDQARGAIDALLDALGDKVTNADVRSVAASALGSLGSGQLGDRAAAVATALLKALADPDLNVQALAARALGSLRSDIPKDRAVQVVDSLLKATKDASPYLLRASTSALADLGADTPRDRAVQVADTFVQALQAKDTDAYVRRVSASAAGRIGAQLPPDKGQEVVEALIAALNDARLDSSIRQAAADALGSLGAQLPKDRACRLVNALLDALRNAEPDVKTAAAGALAVLGAKASSNQVESAVLTLAGFLANPGKEPQPFQSFLNSLRQLTQCYSIPTTDALLDALESNHSTDRTVAIHVLPRRSLSEDHLQRLRRLRDDPERRPWARMAALDTLVEIEREKQAAAGDTQDAGQEPPPKPVQARTTAPLSARFR